MIAPMLRPMLLGLALMGLWSSLGYSQERPANVVLITLDGLRGEEVFTGADQRLMIKENGIDKPEEVKAKYWRESARDRREVFDAILVEDVQLGPRLDCGRCL